MWEFVNFASLLANDAPSNCVTTLVVNGQSLTVPLSVNPTKISLDIHTFMVPGFLHVRCRVDVS